MQIAMVGAGDNDVTATAQLQVLLGVAEEAAPVSLCFHFPAARHPHWPAYFSFPPQNHFGNPATACFCQILAHFCHFEMQVASPCISYIFY